MLETVLKRLQGRTLLQKLIGNTLWQIGDKVLRMFVSLVVGVWVARYLGPADFGLMNFAIAFVAMFTSVSDLGLQAIVIRDLVRRPDERNRILASAFAVRLVGSGVGIAISVIAIALMRPDDAASQLLVLIIALSLFAQPWDLIDYDYQARMMPRPIVLVRGVSLVVFSLIKVALILGGAQLVYFVWTVTGEACLSALLIALVGRVGGVRIKLADARWEEAKYLLKTCWPAAVSSLGAMLYMRVDQIMLGQMLSDQAVGIFAAAVRVSEVWYFVPLAIVASVAPALTTAQQVSERDYQQKLSMIIGMMARLAIVVAAVLTIGAEYAIRLLYGSGYSEASAVLAVHAWAGVFVCYGVATGPWFVNAGLLGLKMIYTTVGAIVNIAMNVYMIPRFGPIGAAVSTLVSYSLAAFFLNAVSRRTRPIFLVQTKAIFAR